MAKRYADHRGQKHEIHIFDTKPRLDRLADAERDPNEHQGDDVAAQIEGFGALGGAQGFLWDWLAGNRIAGDHMDADITGPAHEIVHHRAVQNLKPSRTARFPDNDVGDVMGLCVANHIVRDSPICARDRYSFSSKRFSETKRIGYA